MYRLAVFSTPQTSPQSAGQFWDDIRTAKPRKLKLRSRHLLSDSFGGGEVLYFHCLQDDAGAVEQIWEKYRPKSTSGNVQRRQECSWSRSEIERAELLCVRINRAPAGTHDWSRCRKIDFANPRRDRPKPWAWQASELRLSRSMLPRSEKAINQACDFLIVHQCVVEQVSALKSEEVFLDPVLDLKTDQWNGWYQLGAWRSLPPLSNDSTGFIHGVGHGPNGEPEYFHSDEGIYPCISRSELLSSGQGIPGLAIMHELLGYWRIGGEYETVPMPTLVVSQETRRQLKAAGVTRLIYDPIELVE